MLKLVRLALTAAILTAIAVRLRRRARSLKQGPEQGTEPSGPEPILGRPSGADLARYRVRGKARSVMALLGVAALTAVVFGVFALMGMPIHDREEDPVGEMFRDAARRSAMAATADPAPAQPATDEPIPAESVSAGPTPDEFAPDQAASTPSPAVPDPFCHPEPRPVTVRPLDPKVKRAVDRQWRRVERWLKANAPKTYATLGRPGRAKTIAVAESQMGVDFPDSLRASLLRHNGSRGAGAFGFGAWFDGTVNLGIRDIRDTWRALCANNGTDPAIGWWHGRTIPVLSFGQREGADLEYAVVDSIGGKVGWDDMVSGMSPRLPSYYALMRTVADSLENRTEFDGWRPTVTRGMLRWEKSE
ncbi:SMI1/KNR4 family protein [Nonomuraea sp. NPDC048901]|uniref:SMI1/KNR4 family protein n=1 Tax=Nonomuraea sp. NPDC048901 TaxID=3155627 RepID=UPI0033DCEB84